MPEDSSPEALSNRVTAICTLFEGDYHFGLAAFVLLLGNVQMIMYAIRGGAWKGYTSLFRNSANHRIPLFSTPSIETPQERRD